VQDVSDRDYSTVILYVAAACNALVLGLTPGKSKTLYLPQAQDASLLDLTPGLIDIHRGIFYH
jgi:hypothetical protein